MANNLGYKAVFCNVFLKKVKVQKSLMFIIKRAARKVEFLRHWDSPLNVFCASSTLLQFCMLTMPLLDIKGYFLLLMA